MMEHNRLTKVTIVNFPKKNTLRQFVQKLYNLMIHFNDFFKRSSIMMVHAVDKIYISQFFKKVVQFDTNFANLQTLQGFF